MIRSPDHRGRLRHAEILLALARHPAATPAADLFGDPTRTVTVRAESPGCAAPWARCC